jgi:hypothetical protein
MPKTLQELTDDLAALTERVDALEQNAIVEDEPIQIRRTCSFTGASMSKKAGGGARKRLGGMAKKK